MDDLLRDGMEAGADRRAFFRLIRVLWAHLIRNGNEIQAGETPPGLKTGFSRSAGIGGLFGARPEAPAVNFPAEEESKKREGDARETRKTNGLIRTGR